MLAASRACDNSSRARIGVRRERVELSQSHVRDFYKTVAVASPSHRQVMSEYLLACPWFLTAKVLQSVRTSGVSVPTCPLGDPVPPPDQLFEDRSVTIIANEIVLL